MADKIKCSKPVDAHITSGFGVRIDPVTKKPGEFHKGVDFGVTVGTPIKAALAGEVTVVKWQDPKDLKVGFGYFTAVLTQHPVFGQVLAYYAHTIKSFVKPGDKVVVGQTIVESGNTGKSTGPHLHFQVEKWPSREPLEPEFV